MLTASITTEILELLHGIHRISHVKKVILRRMFIAEVTLVTCPKCPAKPASRAPREPGSWISLLGTNHLHLRVLLRLNSSPQLPEPNGWRTWPHEAFP